MKIEDMLNESNMDLLCQFGSDFLKKLATIGVDVISVSDTELKRTITKMIEGNRAAQKLEKDRAKERKELAKKNSKGGK